MNDDSEPLSAEEVLNLREMAKKLEMAIATAEIKGLSRLQDLLAQCKSLTDGMLHDSERLPH